MSDGQREVDRYFDVASEYWDEIYRDSGVQGHVYRRRMATATDWVRRLNLPGGARVLEVGCGAGLMTAALAGFDFDVVATDSSEEMVRRCKARLETVRAGRVQVQRADAHHLPFGTDDFELVVAIGLLPWLHDPHSAIAELARVVQPGGWLLLTADNRRRLNAVLEPRENPVITPIRMVRRKLRRRRGWTPSSAQSYRHVPTEVDAMLLGAGMVPVHRTTVGFGPFTFMGRSVLSEPAGSRLDAWLERTAARGSRLRGRGWHYLVAARKDPITAQAEP